jgi:hypothetical protein
MITIVSQPQKFTPVFNPVYFSLTSDNYAQPDFKFVADVYNDAGELLVTQKFQPQVLGTEPVDFDVSPFLRELVSADYCKLNSVVNPDLVTTSGGAVSGYSVQFGEQYGGVTYANLVNFSGYVFNGAVNYLRFAFYDQDNYLNTQYLSNFTRQVIRKRDSVTLSVAQSELTAITGFTLNVYSTTGGSLYTTTIINPFTSLAATNNRVLHVHCGFDYLFSVLGFSTTVYNQAAYYTIAPAGGTAMRFDLFSKCERFPGVRLYFLNELGGFDGFNFLLPDRKTITTDSKTYQRQPVNKQTGYDPINKRFETTERNYNTSYTESLKLTSDYLTDDEAVKLTELITSPLIYRELDVTEFGGSGLVLVPVKLKLNEYGIKQTKLDKLFNLELDVQLTHTNYRQSI